MGRSIGQRTGGFPAMEGGPAPIVPTENRGIMSGPMRKPRGGRRKIDKRGSRRGFGGMTQVTKRDPKTGQMYGGLIKDGVPQFKKPDGSPEMPIYAGGGSPIPGVGGHEYLNNPKYAEHRKEYYGKKEKQRERERIGEEYVKNKEREESKRPKGRPAPDFYKRKMFAQKGSKKPKGGIKTPAFGDIGVGGGPGDIPPRFPGGPRDPRTMRGPRREGVFFGEKESPKKVMRKAGSPVDAETKNKFEEMLAYMKSFQR